MSVPPALPTARYARFEGFREYEDRFDALIPAALAVIRVFDRTLSPRYNTAARCRLLSDFLRADARRELRIVLHEADALVRDCPRLLALAADLHPRIRIRRTLAQARHAHDPCIVVDMSHYLHRFHHASMRAAEGRDDLGGARELIERYEQIWEAAAPARTGPPAGL